MTKCTNQEQRFMSSSSVAGAETPAAAAPAELSLEDALLFAIGLHRSGELDDAEKLYRRILEVAPDQPDGLHFLGVLLHQRGQSDAALELIQKSIAIAPE